MILNLSLQMVYIKLSSSSSVKKYIFYDILSKIYIILVHNKKTIVWVFGLFKMKKNEKIIWAPCQI